MTPSTRLDPHRPGDAFGWTRRDLRAEGWSGRDITRAVRAGTLLRARNGFYLAADADEDTRHAAAGGARVTCVSALRRWGVFVLHPPGLHVHFTRNAEELRPLPAGARRHWDRPIRTAHPRSLCSEPLDALLHAVRCQEPRAALASIDSALHLGVVRDEEVDEMFARLPRRYRRLRSMCDGRSESGPESLLRWMLARLGCRYDIQVRIAGVGRVDFLVDGWLIIECDSEAHHEGWVNRRRDLRRDQKAASLGYSTFRPIAEDIMWNPDDVWAALIGLLRSRRSGSRTSAL
jgi:very-short-patch-repair endonuclease